MASRMVFLVVLIFSINIHNLIATDEQDPDNFIGELPWEPTDRVNPLGRHEELLNQTRSFGKEIRGIFLGDSITQNWLNNGKTIWYKYFQPRQVYNYGQSGDLTQNVLWHLLKGELDGIPNCRVIVLMIGTNNVYNYKPFHIATGVHAVLTNVRLRMPNSKILLISVLPRGGNYDPSLHRVNGYIEKFNDNRTVFYMDLTKFFQEEPGSGRVYPEMYNPDLLHLSERGYETYFRAIEKKFFQFLND